MTSHNRDKAAIDIEHKKNFKYDGKDKSKWVELMQIVHEKLLVNEIGYITNPAELDQRRREPPEPAIIPLRPNETRAEANIRTTTQNRIDAEYRKARDRWYTDNRHIDNAFGLALTILMGLCTLPIKADVYGWLSEAPQNTLSAQAKYNAAVDRLGSRWGLRNQSDIEVLRDTLNNLDGDDLGWSEAIQIFDQTVVSMEMTPMRAPDGTIAYQHAVPDIPPRPAPDATPEEWEQYREDIVNAVENARGARGAPLNYRPTDAQLKEYLLAALRRSRISKYFNITNEAVKTRNLNWTYREIRQDILDLAQKDATDETVRKARKRMRSPDEYRYRNANYADRDHRRGYSYSSTRRRDQDNYDEMQIQENSRNAHVQSRDAQSPSRDNHQQSRDKSDTQRTCRNCGATGHMARECPDPKCGICEGVFPDTASRRKHWSNVHAAHISLRADRERQRNRSPGNSGKGRVRFRSNSRSGSPGRTPRHSRSYASYRQSDDDGYSSSASSF
jgi:hypothetical protein